VVGEEEAEEEMVSSVAVEEKEAEKEVFSVVVVLVLVVKLDNKFAYAMAVHRHIRTLVLDTKEKSKHFK
jgi:hypothetical protein